MGPGAFKRLRGPVSILETIWMFSDFWSPRPALGLRALGGVLTATLSEAPHWLWQLGPIDAAIPNASGSVKLTKWSHGSSIVLQTRPSPARRSRVVSANNKNMSALGLLVKSVAPTSLASGLLADHDNFSQYNGGNSSAAALD
jgi:hypothetical protein